MGSEEDGQDDFHASSAAEVADLAEAEPKTQLLEARRHGVFALRVPNASDFLAAHEPRGPTDSSTSQQSRHPTLASPCMSDDVSAKLSVRAVSTSKRRSLDIVNCSTVCWAKAQLSSLALIYIVANTTDGFTALRQSLKNESARRTCNGEGQDETNEFASSMAQELGSLGSPQVAAKSTGGQVAARTIRNRRAVTNFFLSRSSPRER